MITPGIGALSPGPLVPLVGTFGVGRGGGGAGVGAVRGGGVRMGVSCLGDSSGCSADSISTWNSSPSICTVTGDFVISPTSTSYHVPSTFTR